MSYSDPEIASFSLRGRQVAELRELAQKHLKMEEVEANAADKTKLIAELSSAAANNKDLSQELRKGSISLKPSFYLMRFNEDFGISAESARSRFAKYLQQHSTGLSELEIQLVQAPKAKILEVLLTWQTSLTYWAPSFALKQVQQLKFGFVDIDFKVKKAILCCHTMKERQKITELLRGALDLSLSPIILTQKLLEQIGTFDHVKRALYVVSEQDAITPTNITYADDNLAARKLARDEEENPRSKRQQSFYRIPLMNPLIEEGVGATSDSGKLWIPKETPVESVRDYCSALLRRVTDTLAEMRDDDDIEGILSTFDFEAMPNLAGADPLSFRKAIAGLLRQIILMLTGKEKERAYTVPFEIARYGAPFFFFHPRLRLTDLKTDEVAYWLDETNYSPQVAVSGTEPNASLRSYPANLAIDVDSLVHPITGSEIASTNILDHLELLPSGQLLKLVSDTVKVVSNQIPTLKDVGAVFFRLSTGLIILDVARAFGHLGPKPVVIQSEEVAELRNAIVKHPITPAKRAFLNTKLLALGEKCKHMSDENCRTCVQDQQTLCLRSLVGRYLKGAEILAHKGIELCDMKGRGTIGGKERRMWGFAKLSIHKADSGLTALNKSGAVLLAQILGQIDKAPFNTVLVISPSTINQNFAERAEVLCAAFGKELCMLNADDLARLLVDFEEQAKFDKVDVEAIYKRSRTKPKTAKKDTN
jgi:hypothetical protein